MKTECETVIHGYDLWIALVHVVLFVSNLTLTFVTHCRFASPQTQQTKFVTSLRYGIADGYKRMKKEEEKKKKISVPLSPLV